LPSELGAGERPIFLPVPSRGPELVVFLGQGGRVAGLVLAEESCIFLRSPIMRAVPDAVAAGWPPLGQAGPVLFWSALILAF